MGDFTDLEHLRLAAEGLKKRFPSLGSKYVPGEGNMLSPNAFIIGEAPNATEEMQGRPFVGHAGIILRQLMRVANLRPSWCWMTNVIKYRLPGNRAPKHDELRDFRPLLIKEWELVGRPRLIIPVGVHAYNTFMNRPMSLAHDAGEIFMVKRTRVCPMINPIAGVRKPHNQSLIERDWERLGAWIAENS